ncbi:metal ABC transporter permease [Bacillus horti]|uniref:Zinc transport system permease protein n=1 Tax=Caldalkalibacillus horti TaxID=77523 RepID=A0ABT9W4F0_9BACI|nr:metal ABC transporter permease [Bacillus horti]MDQ0168104.1 zinc transport system permease protein [Bacillus horti]
MIEAVIQYEFLRNALLSGMIIGFLAPLIGVFIVVRRLSMIADALSHVTLSGIAFSMLLGKYFAFFSAATLNPIFMGMAFSVAGALSIEKLRTSYKHFQELSIPIILSAGIGLSAIFISVANGFNTDLFTYLFGNILAIRKSDLLTILIIAIVVVAIILLIYKELFSISFDDEHARISGIPRKMINFLFIVMVAVVIASAMKIVGILLVSSLMVLPVAASIKIAKSFKQTIFYSILFGEISVLLGLFISYQFDWASGGTIVVTSLLILLVIMAFKRWILRVDD